MGINKKIGHIKKKIVHSNKKIQYEELKSTNVTCMCNKEANKNKETLSANDIKGKETRTSENKQKARDG